MFDFVNDCTDSDVMQCCLIAVDTLSESVISLYVTSYSFINVTSVNFAAFPRSACVTVKRT